MKDVGYLLSVVSVFLIGYAASDTAARDPFLMTCLMLGIVISVIGIALRWIVYRREKAR